MIFFRNPCLNKGTAFTEADRRKYRLEGLLPPAVTNMEPQTMSRLQCPQPSAAVAFSTAAEIARVAGNYMEQMQAIDGRVTAVRGAVLDVAFEGATLPPIDDALLITPDKGAPIIAEVQSHLDEATVRAIACNREGSGAPIGVVSESDLIRPDRVAREAWRQSSSSTASARYR